MRIRVDELKDKIEKVFPKTQPPLAYQVTADEVGDAALVREILGEKEWWSVDSKSLERIADSVALLTPEAFHYYLPALLAYSLDNLNDKIDNKVLPFTIYNLSPVKTRRIDLPFFYRFRLFNPEQVKTVRSFLKLVMASQLWSYYKDAERGLNKFWILEANE